MQIPRIDSKNALGLVSKVVGLGKEVVGNVTGSKRMAKAGEVQQEKGTERIKAVRAEANAKKEEGKSIAAERAQRAAQRRKESVK